MKLKITLAFLALFLAISTIPVNAAPSSIGERLKGRILLQVESKGEAYYVHPATAEAYYMANGNEAYNIMRDFGVGITNNDLEKIKNSKSLALKHKGKIFLQVESKGEAYYVNNDGILYYLKDGGEAYNIMRKLGLGITNNDLGKINIKSTQKDQIATKESTPYCNPLDGLVYDTEAKRCISGDSVCEKKFGLNWIFSVNQCVCKPGTLNFEGTCQSGDDYCRKTYGENSYYISSSNECSCNSGYSFVNSICTKNQESISGGGSSYSGGISSSFYVKSSDSELDIIDKLFKNNAKIISSCDDDVVFLGTISSKYNSDSIFNKYGDYGSKYDSGSMWNKYGDYGGKYSSCSPFNKYSSDAPSIYVDKKLVGYISLNKYVGDSDTFIISPNSLLLFGYSEYDNDYFLDLMIN